MKNKNYLLFIALLFILNGCQKLKDGLEGNKRSKSAQEFLIKQKNPLVVPPDYKSLPVPEGTIVEQDNEEFDINQIMGQPKNQKYNNLEKKDQSLEKSIIKIIKKN